LDIYLSVGMKLLPLPVFYGSLSAPQVESIRHVYYEANSFNGFQCMLHKPFWIDFGGAL
jgi:hypothetical protein